MVLKVKESPPLGHQVVTGICGICPAGCINNIHLVEGKIQSVQPLAHHKDSIVCPRGSSAKEIVYSPDRILYPQLRTGSRGDGKYEQISWEAAYQFLVEKLRLISAQYGPEAVAIYTGRGNFEYGLNEAFAPSGTVESSANAVLFPFGSPNTSGVGSLCFVSYGIIAGRACFGDYHRNIYEDLDRADLILVWGANPATDSPPSNLPRLKKAQKRGARVIVIDHRRNETAIATRAEWIGIRPGTDGALALGLIQVLLHEDRYNHDFVENWTHGFEELRNYVKDFTPDIVSQITWIPAVKIVELARIIGNTRSCSILTYTGLEYSNTGLQAIRAVFTLQAIAGFLDIPGGKIFRMPDRPRNNRNLSDPPKNRPKPIGAEEFPLYYAVRNEAHASMFPRAILEGIPYPLRGLVISGASIITAWPDPELWSRSFQALDLLVVVNRFPTADSAFADLILPATTMFEIESYVLHDDLLILRKRIIPPLGEARNDYLIFAELARRLGYGDRWPQTETRMIEQALIGTGVSLEELSSHPEGIRLSMPAIQYRKYATGILRQDGKPGFNTPTGKFEITSEWLRSFGYEPLPKYTEVTEGPISAPGLVKTFPLVFNSGARTNFDFRSQHHNIPSLIKGHPFPLVHMHLKDAQARGIFDGDEVVVVSPRGRVIFTARVTENILPGVVEVNMGGGGPLGPEAWQKGNVNILTDANNVDEISGFPVFKALLCDIVRRD